MRKRNKIYRKMIKWFEKNEGHMYKGDYFEFAGEIELTELYMFEPKNNNNKSIIDHRDMQIFAILFSIEMTNH